MTEVNCGICFTVTVSGTKMNGVYFGILLLGVTVCARSVDEWPVVSLDNENGRQYSLHSFKTFLELTSI